MENEYVLDPLWITKGSDELDPEYYSYILLAANKKYRSRLDDGDVSGFHEVLFHSLNLNNLAIEGSLFEFNMKPIWNNPRLEEIRHHLRKLYELPEDLVEIFKNANFLLTGLIMDHLESILDESDGVKIYFVNAKVHRENDIFIVINKEHDMVYDIWKLRFDKRFKFGHKIEHHSKIELTDLRENALADAILELDDPTLNKMNADKNVVFAIYKEDKDHKKVADIITSSIHFNKGMAKDLKFEPNILDELHELITREKVMPFTMKSWT